MLREQTTTECYASRLNIADSTPIYPCHRNYCRGKWVNMTHYNYCMGEVGYNSVITPLLCGWNIIAAVLPPLPGILRMCWSVTFHLSLFIIINTFRCVVFNNPWIINADRWHWDRSLIERWDLLWRTLLVSVRLPRYRSIHGKILCPEQDEGGHGRHRRAQLEGTLGQAVLQTFKLFSILIPPNHQTWAISEPLMYRNSLPYWFLPTTETWGYFRALKMYHGTVLMYYGTVCSKQWDLVLGGPNLV